jgi:hypothetical protein
MFAISKSFISAEWSFQTDTNDRQAVAKPTKSPREQERALWKVAVQAQSPKIAMLERCVLVIFLASACAGIITGMMELSYTLDSDSIGYLASSALNAAR